MKKLSPAQIRVLKALAEEGAVAYYMRSMGSFQPNPYWSLPKGRANLTTMRLLIQYKLLKPTYDKIGYFDTATITPAGKAYLEKNHE